MDASTNIMLNEKTPMKNFITDFTVPCGTKLMPDNRR